ncbi:MAG: 2-dehydropantoate 2-reductase [Chloroflexi bacterium]|nr:2-dehydropantoate 2-reductase [Chloroflexota bacterium]
MRIAVFGAGAIGGYLGAMLSLAGEEVTLVARGPHLAAMRARGLRLQIEGEERVAHPRCVEDPAEAGPQDAVFLTLKAHQVPPVVDGLRALLRAEAPVVTAQNGVPWWYFHRLEGPWEGRRLESVDPGGRIWEGIGPERAIGCVVYPATEIVEPGVIRHVEGDRFTLGEPDGSSSERVTALAKALVGARLRAPVRRNIRNDLWVKLWGNVAFNPISALTRATLDVVCTDPGTRALARGVMLEAAEVAKALGEELPLDVERRIDGAARVGAHRTSMLQDIERGRPTEVDAIVGAVAELGRIAGVATPQIEMLAALVRQLEATAAR